MDATAERILADTGVDAAVAHLDADPTRVVHGREAFREWMQDLADRTIAAMADVHFDIPAEDGPRWSKIEAERVDPSLVAIVGQDSVFRFDAPSQG